MSRKTSEQGTDERPDAIDWTNVYQSGIRDGASVALTLQKLLSKRQQKLGYRRGYRDAFSFKTQPDPGTADKVLDTYAEPKLTEWKTGFRSGFFDGIKERFGDNDV